MSRILILGSMALALASCSAANGSPAEISVANGWAREIAQGQSAAAVYLTIANTGAGSDRLVGVESTLGEAALHTTSSEGGVARMRPVEGGLEVAPRSTIELKPGGTHIMLTGITARPTAGQSIAVTLDFDRSGKRPVTVRVVAAGADDHSDHGMRM
jgi:copper(I)-binding protein